MKIELEKDFKPLEERIMCIHHILKTPSHKYCKLDFKNNPNCSYGYEPVKINYVKVRGK